MTWKGIRGTLRWTILLLLIGVIVAGGIAARWWAAKDQWLADLIQTQVAASIPDCVIEFEAARFVDTGHIELTHLQLHDRKSGMELLRIPRVVVEIETSILRTHRRIVVREIMVQSPEASLFRDADERWNWASVRIQPPPSAISPTWVIRNGTLRIGCVSPMDGKMRAMALQGIQVSFEPDSFQNYGFIGTSVAEGVGPLQWAGHVDTHSGEWSLRGSAGEVRLNDSLLDLAGRFVPQVQEKLTELRATNRAFLAQSQEYSPRHEAATASPARTTAAVTLENGGTALLRADLSVQFEAGQSAQGAPLYFDLQGMIAHGHVSDALLPIPLYDLEGRFRITPDLVEIHSLKAANGPSTLFVNGQANRSDNGWAKDFQIQAAQLQLDERIRSFLWGQLAASFDMLSPSGTFDVDVQLAHIPGQRPTCLINKFKVIDCRALCDYFRYPVEHIHGEVTQKGSAFLLNLRGEAGGHAASLTGTIDLPNPDRNLDLRISTADFPFDTTVSNALQRPEQQVIRKVLESLNLRGTVKSSIVDLIRGPETGDKVAICLQAELVDGSLNYVGFPYEVSGLKGKLIYNPLQRNTWIFEDVSGVHGETRISGRGFYDLEQGPGQLALEMAVLQAVLDHDLEKASVTASPSLSAVWNDFSLKGIVDIDQVLVTWAPDIPCDVTLEGIHWNGGQFMSAAIPYRWNNVSGTLTWKDQRLKIHTLHGEHNGTYLLINGATPNSAFIEIEPSPDVAWRMFLDERILHIVKLSPDDELRRAMPEFVGRTLQSVDLRGTVDLSLGLDVKGWQKPDLVTASWSALTALKENTLMAGVALNNVTGNVVHRGSWDGQNLLMEGYLELDSLNSLELSFQKARGPFQFKNNRLTLGTPRLSGNEPVHHQSNPYRREQLRAGLYGGQIGLDIDISMGDIGRPPRYQLDITVNDAELGDWAREHGMNSQRLMGKVNGVLQASGQADSSRATTGAGWIQITPAALYELPVFAQMFTVLSFRPAQPGDAAFKYAYGDFTIRDEMFEFTKIELWGDAISLVGRGNVGYAGTKASSLELDFYSMANNRIPFLGPLVKAVSDRWIRVQVFGTVSQPVARVQPRIPYLNDAFSGFMQALESGQPQRTPPRSLPR